MFERRVRRLERFPTGPRVNALLRDSFRAKLKATALVKAESELGLARLSKVLLWDGRLPRF